MRMVFSYCVSNGIFQSPRGAFDSNLLIFASVAKEQIAFNLINVFIISHDGNIMSHVIQCTFRYADNHSALTVWSK